MSHCITIPPAISLSATENFRVHQIPAGTDNLIWAIEYQVGLCAVVDGPSAVELLEYCNQHNLQITTILNTHTHGDHIGVNKDLGKRGLMEKIQVYGSALRASEIPHITHPVQDGDIIHLGELEGKVISTEGHINGHISFLFADFLFCGDCLFSGGCGYLFDGPPSKMFHSLQKLACLADDTKVCCAHEYTEDNLLFAHSIDKNNPALIERIAHVQAARRQGKSTLPSTIALEKATNPFVRSVSVEEFTSKRELKNAKIYKTMSFYDIHTNDINTQ